MVKLNTRTELKKHTQKKKKHWTWKNDNINNDDNDNRDNNNNYKLSPEKKEKANRMDYWMKNKGMT